MNTYNTMNTLFNIDPLKILEELLNYDSRMGQTMRARAAGKYPPVNVYLDDNAVMVDVELPGKTAKDVNLTLEPLAVVVADKPEVPVDENGKPGEAPSPKWTRRIELPFRVNEEKANAKFTDGILRIVLPKADNAGARHINIEG